MGAAFQITLRIAIFLYICLIAYPPRYHPIAAGTDGSWAYALNYAHGRHLVFGKEAGFNYGPLGYLIMPMPVGRNLAEGIAFQLGIWASFAGLLAWLTFWRKFSLVRLALLAVGLVAGGTSFRMFGYSGGDTFLVFLVLLLLGCALTSTHWQIFYAFALALSAVLFFVKFSSVISVISAMALFVAALVLRDRRRVWHGALGLALWPVAVCASSCLVLEPSPAVWWHYARVGLEISSGFSVTMSELSAPGAAAAALVMLAAWIIGAALLYWCQEASWPLAFACIGPLALEYKHSFVREAGHAQIFLFFLPLAWGAVAFYTEFSRKKLWYLAAAFALPAAAWCSAYSEDRQGRLLMQPLWQPSAALDSLQRLGEIMRFTNLRRRLESASAQGTGPDRLPPDALQRIAGASVAPFPMECGYAAANRIDMRLFPTPQMYQAYTPFLDRWDAEFLEDPRSAPVYILFDWETIDGRHPLLDVPATAQAMYRHYEFDGMYGTHMLLLRRKAPRFGFWRPGAMREISLSEPLRIPRSDQPLIARIYLRWNLSGQLLKLFFRVPEVRLILTSATARVLNVRVPSEVMEDGVPINFLPFDREEAKAVFAGRPMGGQVETLSIGGPGARYLEPRARVEIDEAFEGKLRTGN